jgi:hypothetical protein
VCVCVSGTDTLPKNDPLIGNQCLLCVTDVDGDDVRVSPMLMTSLLSVQFTYVCAYMHEEMVRLTRSHKNSKELES